MHRAQIPIELNFHVYLVVCLREKNKTHSYLACYITDGTLAIYKICFIFSADKAMFSHFYYVYEKYLMMKHI